MLNANSFPAKVWTNKLKLHLCNHSNKNNNNTSTQNTLCHGSLKHCVGRCLVSRCRHSGGETRPMPTLTRHRCALIRSRRRAAQRATDTNKHQQQPQINGCTERLAQSSSRSWRLKLMEKQIKFWFFFFLKLKRSSLLFRCKKWRWKVYFSSCHLNELTEKNYPFFCVCFCYSCCAAGHSHDFMQTWGCVAALGSRPQLSRDVRLLTSAWFQEQLDEKFFEGAFLRKITSPASSRKAWCEHYLHNTPWLGFWQNFISHLYPSCRMPFVVYTSVHQVVGTKEAPSNCWWAILFLWILWFLLNILEPMVD